MSHPSGEDGAQPPFEQLVEPVADFCAPMEITRGLAVGDIDNDGDIDLLVSNVHDRFLPGDE